MKQILIDTDPGIDDAIALIMALASAELDVQAITVTAGNCDVDQGVQNALAIVELMNALAVPVARGAEHPRIGPYVGSGSKVHGLNGLGGAELPLRTASIDPRPSAQLIVDVVRRAPGRVTIVALAPLTNLADAIELSPEIVTLTRRVVIMGGALTVAGNATEYAECNMYNDPVAARIVFSSGIPVTLVPLDVTRSASIGQEVFASGLKEFADNPVTKFLTAATADYFKHHRDTPTQRTAILHDPLALALVMMPNLVRCERRNIVVDIANGPSLGRTYIVDEAGETCGAEIEVAVTLDIGEFRRLVMACLRRAAAAKVGSL